MACALLSSESSWQEIGVTKKNTLRDQGRERGKDRAWRDVEKQLPLEQGRGCCHCIQDTLLVGMATVIIYVNC